jgi:aspartyl-tRNA(Asn)/glutamyl-tRNA(Gln) amidotransferase subunit C
MALTPSDIARIAQLARLDLSEPQQAQMLGQINGFFDLVEQMGQVNTAGVEPLAHPIETVSDIALRLREDKATEPNEREANQQSAPLVERGLYLVPRVIE